MLENWTSGELRLLICSSWRGGHSAQNQHQYPVSALLRCRHFGRCLPCLVEEGGGGGGGRELLVSVTFTRSYAFCLSRVPVTGRSYTRCVAHLCVIYLFNFPDEPEACPTAFKRAPPSSGSRFLLDDASFLRTKSTEISAAHFQLRRTRPFKMSHLRMQTIHRFDEDQSDYSDGCNDEALVGRREGERY